MQQGQPPGFYCPDEIGRAVFRDHRIRCISYDQFKAEVLNYANKWKSTGLNNVPLDHVKQIATVFHFQTRTLPQMRRELLRWLECYQQFYNDNALIIYQRMCQALHEYQQSQIEKHNLRQVCPYVNWIPQYGGIFLPAPITQSQWHKNNGVPFEGEEETPVEIELE